MPKAAETAEIRLFPSTESEMSAVQIKYFSDVLCVWAYVSQARVDAIKGKFGDAIAVEYRFCSVFGDTVQKINSSWKDKGGYEGFNAHLRQVAAKFPHVPVHPDIWLKTRPVTSASPHLFLKAAQQCGNEAAPNASRFPPNFFDRLIWAFPFSIFQGLPRHFALGRPVRYRSGPWRRHRPHRRAHSFRRRICRVGG